jgi:hypothetical protein
MSRCGAAGSLPLAAPPDAPAGCWPLKDPAQPRGSMCRVGALLVPFKPCPSLAAGGGAREARGGPWSPRCAGDDGQAGRRHARRLPCWGAPCIADCPAARHAPSHAPPAAALAATAGVLQVRGNGIKLLAPKPLDFDGFSWVAGPQSSQDDIFSRELRQTLGVCRGRYSGVRYVLQLEVSNPPLAPHPTRLPQGVGAPMVDSLRAGFNSTILAYGDSGSGKTHTMIGPPGARSEAEVCAGRGHVVGRWGRRVGVRQPEAVRCVGAARAAFAAVFRACWQSP